MITENAMDIWVLEDIFDSLKVIFTESTKHKDVTNVYDKLVIYSE